MQLARLGLNVVIISRSKEKLQKVSDEISKNLIKFVFSELLLACMLVERTFNREVRIISVDFSQGQVVYPNIAEQIKDIDVGILGEFKQP